MSNGSVITLDGLAATGKTAVAVALSKRLGWHVLYSGLLYRYLAYCMQKEGFDVDMRTIPDAWVRRLGLITCEVDQEGVLHTFVDGEDMGDSLAQESVGSYASIIARNEYLREVLLPIQRAYRQPPGLIAEGRDMSLSLIHI